MAVGTLKAILTLDTNGFSAGLKSAQSGMKDVMANVKDTGKQITESLGNKAKGAFNSLADAGDKLKQQTSSLPMQIGKVALAYAGISSAAEVFNSAVGRVDKIESAKKSIEALTGSQKAATTVMEGLQNVVDGTPLSLDSFTASAKGMIAAGMEAGKVEGVMKAVGDAAFGVGNGAESIDIISSAFKSLQASGTASLGDLSRLMDQNIPVYKILGNELGMTTEEVKKYISSGLLPSADAIDILTKGIEKGTDGVAGKTSAMAGQMTTAGDTIQGALGNIKTAVVKSLAVPLTESYEKIVTGLKGAKDGIKTMQPQMEAAFTAIAQIIEGVILGAIDWFNQLKPTIDSVVDFVKKLVSAFQSFLPEGTSLTDIVRKLTPILLSMFAAFKGYQTVAKFASTARGVSQVLQGTKTASTALEKGFGLLKTGISGVSKAFSFLAGHPIILVIAVIAALVAGIVYLWNTNEDFRNAIISAWEKVKSFFSALGEFFSGLWDGIVGIFTAAVDLIKAPFEGIAEWFMEIFNASGLGESISTTWEGIKNIFTTVMDSIKLVFETGWNAIVSYFQSVWAVISAIFGTAWNVIYAVISVAIQLVWGVIQQYLDLIVSICTTAWNTVVEVASIAWNLLKTVIGSVLSVIFTVISTVLNNIKTVFSTIWDVIKIIVTTAINVVKGIITAVMAVIRGDWQGAWNAIKGVLSTVWNGMKSVVSTVANGIKSVISNTWNGIKSVTTTVWNAIKEAMLAPIRAGKSVISGIVDSIKKLFNFSLKFPKIEIPHIPLPHFRLSGSFNPLKGQIPSIGIDWYATGGIFTGASVIGVGEAGDEAVVPLSNKARMKPFASAISSFLKDDDSSAQVISARQSQPILLHNKIEIDGREFVYQVAEYLQEAMDDYMEMQERKLGNI